MWFGNEEKEDGSLRSILFLLSNYALVAFNDGDPTP